MILFLARRLLVAAAFLALALLPLKLAAQQRVPTIAVAANAQVAMEEILADFRKATGLAVRVSYGSSGNFTRQIEQGAPFELFVSADEGFVFRLADAGRTQDRGELYAQGRIVLFVPKTSRLKADATLDDLRAALADGRLKRFAIASPEHAPYGRAAQQALTKQGLWDAIRPSLVIAENIAQATQFAASGGADGGIVAYSLALAPNVAPLGSHVLLPADWHAPLLQRMVLIKGAGETARAFYDYLRSPPARVIFRKYGFLLPGEAS